MQKLLLKKLNRILRTLINDLGCFPLDFEPYRSMSASLLKNISIKNFKTEDQPERFSRPY